mmetsp:Transcript_4720/g.14401  ORF Transcript_4720/g.14401 Transcript_4720/m.14401 type:complete len:330 (+) Transcript_4720:44-1033(+)|eukprot:CAMPEP_0113677798 /NCGR_PEP_ID=MMETSP0038_2-20120614/9510_1 /TAXON_ID=2898 /ORGANISM="Cryptomonas paramecium" /LENGTH=329 /DNA_ID=CAMNT_0000595201 /DNA_START=17 /DNA_END=1006 /DNA_ORIENTATION=- /assembly_acc=CAM_ASM_000170
MRTTKQAAFALFVISALGLSLLVHVITTPSKNELMGGRYFVPRQYSMALEPTEEGAEPIEAAEPLIEDENEAQASAEENPEVPETGAAEGGVEAPFAGEDGEEEEDEEPTIAEQEPVAAAAAQGQADPETTYTTLHPVYARCKSKVDMLGFSLAIQKTCGDIHELNDVAWPCRSAMQDYSKKFGCCWETVMDAYEALYPEAAQSWRLWQGTLSGKAGVTFDSENCGDSMGEKGYTDLTKKVSGLENVIETQSQEILTLESYLAYGGNPYYYYYFKSHPGALKSGKLPSSLAALAPSKAFHPAAIHQARSKVAHRKARSGDALRRAGINV